jgi:hypothetical protein
MGVCHLVTLAGCCRLLKVPGMHACSRLGHVIENQQAGCHSCLQRALSTLRQL